MKNLVAAISGLAFLVSCGEPAETPAADAPAAAAEEQVNYAYTIENPDVWEIGSKKNTAVALAALKAWESNDQAGAAQYFSDSVKMMFDNTEQYLERDSALASMFGYRQSLKDVKIMMYDWIPTTSKDKSDEYVSIWYTQVVTNADGSVDSLAVMDDVKLKDGKIYELSEYTRKLGPPKK